MIKRATPVAVTTAALVAAAPAAAHVASGRTRRSAAARSHARSRRVKVTFKGRVTDGHLTVRNASGDKVSIGDGRLVNRKRTVRVRLRGGLARGRYTASFSALHTDGHVMNKSWNFNLN